MNDRIIDGEIIGSRLDDVRAYDGVRTRRIVAFLLDYLIVGLLLIPFGILVFVLGLLTLRRRLVAVRRPRAAGGDHLCLEHAGRAEPGDDRHARDGHPPRPARRHARSTGMTAVVHSVLFWAGNVILTPLVLLVTLFTDRKRTLHDLLLGTVVSRTRRLAPDGFATDGITSRRCKFMAQGDKALCRSRILLLNFPQSRPR